MPGQTEAVAGKPRPSLLLLQVRQTREVRVSSSVVFQLSLSGGGEDQVQRAQQVGWTHKLGFSSNFSSRFNCFLCNFDLCESCVYRKAQTLIVWKYLKETFIFPSNPICRDISILIRELSSGSWGGRSWVWRRNRGGTDRAGCSLPQLQL